MCNIPNILTVLRILFTVLFVLVFNTNREVAALIFILALFTDALDGIIARVKNIKTKIGAVLDPIADKALLVSGFILLYLNGYISKWYIIIIISRDLIIIIGWLFLYLKVKKMSMPLFIGKTTNVFQAITIFMYIVFNKLYLVDVFAYITLGLTVSSGVIYLIRSCKYLKTS